MLNKEEQKETGFMMTIIPSKKYIDEYGDAVQCNTYMHRSEHLSGYVLFHNINGAFVNGWEYNNGKIKGKISSQKTINSDSISLNSLSADYIVKSSNIKTYSVVDDDSTAYYIDLPEVVVYPPDYSNYDDYSRVVAWLAAHGNNGGYYEGNYTNNYDNGDGCGGNENSQEDPVLSSLYSKNSSLSTYEKTLLQNAFSDMNNQCEANKKMCNYLIEHGVKITFCIDAQFVKNKDKDAQAAYDRINNRVVFLDASTIMFGNLREELFHAVQYCFYNNKMEFNYKNFEFEAKIYRTILAQLCGDQLFIEAASFIDNIISYGWNDSYLNEYYELMNNWHDSHYQGNINYDIEPEVLMYLFDEIYKW